MARWVEHQPQPWITLKQYVLKTPEEKLDGTLRMLRRLVKKFPDLPDSLFGRLSVNIVQEALMALDLGIPKEHIETYLLKPEPNAEDVRRFDVLKGNYARLKRFKELGLDKLIKK